MRETMAKAILQMPSWAFVALATAASFIVVLPLAPLGDALVRAGVPLPSPLAGEQSLALRVMVAVIVAPPLETALAQWLPIRICRARLGLSIASTVVVSATVFGLLHTYSAFYVLVTFVAGLVLAGAFLLAEARRESPVWIVTLIHALRNAAVLLYKAAA